MNNFKWTNILKGFGMGTSDLIPGVSGGTIALLLGIYDDFISSVSGLFSKRFGRVLNFTSYFIRNGFSHRFIKQLIQLFIKLSRNSNYVLFTGLIIGIIPYLLKLLTLNKLLKPSTI